MAAAAEPTLSASPSPLAPVVCLPGLLGNAQVFAPLAAAVAPRPLWPMDLGCPTFKTEPEAVLKRDRARPESARGIHLLAGSYGGLVAQALAAQPSGIPWLSAALIATAPGRSWVRTRRTRAQRHLLATAPESSIEALYRAHLKRTLVRDGLSVSTARALAARGLSRSMLIARIDAVLAFDLPPWPPDLPILWLRGADDPLVTWSPSAESTLSPSVLSDTVPGGHRPYASHPAALAQRLTPWWDAHTDNF